MDPQVVMLAGRHAMRMLLSETRGITQVRPQLQTAGAGSVLLRRRSAKRDSIPHLMTVSNRRRCERGAWSVRAALACVVQVRGQWYEVDGRLWMPVFHPSYLLRNSKWAPGAPLALIQTRRVFTVSSAGSAHLERRLESLDEGRSGQGGARCEN